jgi:hypothetical protein
MENFHPDLRMPEKGPNPALEARDNEHRDIRSDLY